MYDRVHFEGVWFMYDRIHCAVVDGLCMTEYTVEVCVVMYDRVQCEGVGGLCMTEYILKVWVICVYQCTL